MTNCTVFKTVLGMEMFGLWSDCRTGHSGGLTIDESGLLRLLIKQTTNEGVRYEKKIIWARVIGCLYRYIFEWLRIDVWPAESEG